MEMVNIMHGDIVYPNIMENHICKLIDKDVDVDIVDVGAIFKWQHTKCSISGM